MNLSKRVAVVLLITSVFVFQSCNQPTEVKKKTDDIKTEKSIEDENEAIQEAAIINAEQLPINISIAYVNTDSLMSQYEFYKDASKKIQAYETKIQKKYEYKARKLKEDYDKYIEQAKAGMLTLKQQQDTEASLQQEQQELMQMEQSLGQQSNMQRQTISTEVTDTIISFLNNYRIEKNYTLILNYGSMSGLLSADKRLDITNDVVSRLNAKYDFDKRH
ncbi:MAG: OmpH family outer membrane protein [Bacteroidales bacterium]|nr:OmpH family outer membrane protein [Bacteroidales bacterium]